MLEGSRGILPRENFDKNGANWCNLVVPKYATGLVQIRIDQRLRLKLMAKEWWRVQLILNSVLKHNKFATSPASTHVNKVPNLSIISSNVFLK